MKKWIFWKFERGSFQYDVLCALILLILFATPPEMFNDRPDFMRIPDSDIGLTEDNDGNEVYTIKAGDVSDVLAVEQIARQELRSFLQSEEPLDIFRSEAVYNTRGGIVAYVFWLR